MAKNTDYIPGPDGKFNDFQVNLGTMVFENAGRWGIPAKTLEEAAPYAERWNNAWAIAKNKDGRTKADVGEKTRSREEYVPVIRTIVKQYLATNPLVTDKERELMGLTVPTDTHTPRPEIKSVPTLKLRALGGGAVSVECRADGDSSRPSIHPDADLVELRFKIGEPAPANTTETNEGHNSTKGSFTLKFGDENSLKRLYCFARWVNTSDSSKSGLWSSVFTVGIS